MVSIETRRLGFRNPSACCAVKPATFLYSKGLPNGNEGEDEGQSAMPSASRTARKPGPGGVGRKRRVAMHLKSSSGIIGKSTNMMECRGKKIGKKSSLKRSVWR